MELDSEDIHEAIFDADDIDEDEDGGEDEDELYSSPSSTNSILQSTDVGRVFIVSTARCIEGHRPSVTLQGETKSNHLLTTQLSSMPYLLSNLQWHFARRPLRSMHRP